MNIGKAAKRSGVPAKTIRYYEEIGLIPKAVRTESGYRDYSEQDVQMLRFIHRSRALGFPVKEVAELLALWRDRSRSSAQVKELALHRIADIDTKIAELKSIRHTLTDLATRCHGDDRPDCPIIEDLASGRV
jgi:Cu(I)-responsive transcriptional regulator